MKRVARVAGVSLATASRAIRRRGYVAPKTRERVLRAARQLGYQMNLKAQSLRTGRTYVWGHVLPSSYLQPFHAALCHYLARVASDCGYALNQCETRDDPGRERCHFEKLVRHRVDGVVVTSVQDCKELEILTAAQVSWCLVECPSDKISEWGGVLIDHRYGVRLAVEYLLARGHRRIGFLGVESDQSVEREHLERFGWAMEEAGMRGGKEMIYLALGYTVEWGRELARRMIQSPQRSSAVFVASDMIAIGALQELYARRIRVPEDISVMNFEDNWGQNMVPLMTYIHMPGEEAAEAAVELILDRIGNPSAPAVPDDSADVGGSGIDRTSTRFLRVEFGRRGTVNASMERGILCSKIAVVRDPTKQNRSLVKREPGE